MKKLVSLVLALVLIFGLLAACTSKPADTTATPAPAASGSQTGSSTSGSSGSEPETNDVVTELRLPLTDNAIEFSMWAPSNMVEPTIGYTDPATNPVFQKLAELTNVSLRWEIPTSGNEATSFSLMVASQEYTDGMLSGSWYMTGGEQYFIII